MRTGTSILEQRVSDAQAARLKPIVVGVHNYNPNGVKMKVKSQSNLSMKRGYKATIELEHYGKTMEVMVDRDELIMMLQLEGK